ncbi:Zn-ribbon domain-containing OB-fold protein [Mycobacterium sp. EPa45]|uniref:Zn-ribbon domain-containing OB-fold protein n=1 Tax=Mycobacterium sp. EPa45 TaxID=1545728 RepID=UPI000641C088|nr:OB-fold domain-containing protein [Mycobacterium sp. EPa45]AKK26662.1 hypothetical protein AB431_08120 [Mycobacterium sp. EPa45]
MTAARPLPVPDEASAPYWAAAAQHVLTVARCGHCGFLALPPDAVCASCGSTDPGYTFVPVSGGGTVRSWTVVRQSFLPGFEVPFALVDVELDEQADLRVIGRLLGRVDDVALGTAVRVVFEDIAPETAIPAFELVS